MPTEPKGSMTPNEVAELREHIAAIEDERDALAAALDEIGSYACCDKTDEMARFGICKIVDQVESIIKNALAARDAEQRRQGAIEELERVLNDSEPVVFEKLMPGWSVPDTVIRRRIAALEAEKGGIAAAAQ